MALFLLVAGCGSSASTPDRGRALNGEALAECPLGALTALCGTLTVPEDRGDPTGRTIDLRVVVIPATGDDPAPDPVFFLDGGPGAAATEGFRSVPWWLPGALAELGGDPRFYTTSVAMDDLDDVRAALGYDQINLHGTSYGGTAAQYYLRQYGEHVRSVVLDGTSLLDVPVFERLAASSQSALDTLFARCQADAACAQAYPDLATTFEEVLAQLEREPVTLSVADPVTGEPIVLDAAYFAANVLVALMRERLVSQLPQLIYAARAGEWEAISRVIAEELAEAPVATDEPAKSLVILCSEAWAVLDPARTAAESTGSFLETHQVQYARDQERICRHVPPGVVPDDDGARVTSDVPVLLIVGGADPYNPPANVAGAPTELPNSVTVVAPGHGHVLAHADCFPSIVTAFVTAGTAAGLDVSCVADFHPPSFVTTP